MVIDRGLAALRRGLATDAPRWATGTIILAGGLTGLVLNLPGHFTYDSVVQLAEGRSGSYSGAHPPVMSWLLGLADAVRPGAAAFVALDVLLVTGALAGFALVGKPGGWLTPALAAAAFFSPQLLIYPAIVWKDVLFAGSACAGFACLAWAAEVWSLRRTRYVLLAAGLGLATLAALARQNGAIVLPFAGAAVGWMIAADSGRWRGAAAGGAFAAAGAALTLVAGAALDTRLDQANPIGQAWNALHAYDLVAALAREPQLELSIISARRPQAAELLRTRGVSAYSPRSIDSIEPVQDEINGEGQISWLIEAQWRALVLRHPLLYLRVRAEAFRWVALQPRPLDCVLIETGVDGPPDELARAGLSERDTPRDDVLDAYALGFAGTPVYSHAAYAAVGALLMAGLLRRRRPADIVAVAMLASAFAFAASFFVISVACDYRYLYFLDLSVIAATLYASAAFGRRRSTS